MAAEETQDTKKKSGTMGGVLVWVVVLVFSVGGGFATPWLVQYLNQASSQSAGQLDFDPNEPSEYIDFPEIVAVLGQTRLSRYLKIQMTLQIPKSQRQIIEKKVDAKTAVLRNRVIAFVADLSEEEIAGQQGQNRLRREFQAFFNQILFDDGIERVQDVFFREFQVQ